MTPTQEASFTEGTGAVFTAEQLLQLIQAVGAVVLLTYVAWLCVNAYQDYGNEYISSKDMLTIWLRGIVMLMFLLFLLKN